MKASPVTETPPAAPTSTSAAAQPRVASPADSAAASAAARPAYKLVEHPLKEPLSAETKAAMDFTYAKREGTLFSGFPDDPKDLSAWAAVNAKFHADFAEANEAFVAQYAPTIEETTIADVPVLHITPKDGVKSKKKLIYMHGGGFAIGTAKDTLAGCVPLSTKGGFETFSIDYTTSPHAKSEEIQQQLMAVILKLGEKHGFENLVLYGDSAGGNLATVMALQLQALKKPTPAALVLYSPWLDLTHTSHSMNDPKQCDPHLTKKDLDLLARTYVEEGSDLEDPNLSPVFGCFEGDFPRTLIVGGTQERLRDDWTRLAEQTGAELHLHDGFWHDCAAFNSELKEMQQAIEDTVRFIEAG